MPPEGIEGKRTTSATAEAHAKTAAPNGKVKDALDNVRAAAQELHGALSDAATKRGGAIKADLEDIPFKAKAVADSIKGSLAAQNAATKKSLGEAVTYLEATGTLVTAALKSSGHAAESSIQRAMVDARNSVQKISEAVAEKRSAASKPNPKKKEASMRNFVTVVFADSRKAYDGLHALWQLDEAGEITVHGTAVAIAMNGEASKSTPRRRTWSSRPQLAWASAPCWAYRRDRPVWQSTLQAEQRSARRQET